MQNGEHSIIDEGGSVFMIQQIKMPSAGQTTDAARIVSIKVQAGDRVKRGDVLLEAETDKAVLPVESYAAGLVLEVLVGEGDDVTAGMPLVAIGSEEDQKSYTPGGKAPAAVPDEAPAQPAADAPEARVPAGASGTLDAEQEYLPILGGAVRTEARPAPQPAQRSQWPAMPNAKMLARELGVDLGGLSPANGVMLTRKDVRAAQAAVAGAASAAPEEADYEVVPQSRMRQAIARRMLESVRAIPAFQCTVAVDMEGCMALRKLAAERYDVKLSYNDILAKAVAAAARKYPLINARFEEDEIRMFRRVNIGLAVALDGALVVPVARGVDGMGLWEISQQYRELVQKARDGRLRPDEMGCGCITISNLGMFDVTAFTAIVNPPESCILAVGGISVQPVWDGEQFRPVHRMNVTGSFDHRIVDGAYGAKFLQELRTLLESPALMLC